MSAVGEESSVFEMELDELIADFLQAVQAGETLDRHQLLAEHPRIAAELQAFFDDHDWMHGLSGAPLFSNDEESLDDSQLSLGTTIIPAIAPRVRLPIPRPEHKSDQAEAFGDYDLLQEIGRGGMGVIYKARQRSLNRTVALKMIRSSHLASPEEVDRFRSEAELAAGLDHPGIVPIYEVGEQSGQQYYSMGLVEGVSLGELLLKEQVLSPQVSADLVRRIALSIEYAHSRGVIHRDLKPANVLLAPSSSQSGVALSIAGVMGYYEPKVTDFGLAKSVASDSGLTGTGQILGTPSYMAPEQASGNTESVGPLADVYSLGAMLYCLLTGRPPFRAANVLETLKQVINNEPVSPRQLNTAIPRDLETICLKCLNKVPAERYASALELAKDLQRFQNGEPAHARPIRGWERSWKWIKRRPLAATLCVVSLIAALASVGLVVNYSYQAERERILYAARTMSAHQWIQNGDPMRARQILVASDDKSLHGFEHAYLTRLTESGVVKTLDGNSYTALGETHAMYDSLGVDIEYDPTGRHLAASIRRGPILIWDVKAGTEPVKLARHSEKVQALSFSHDGQRIATAGREGTIVIWSVADHLSLLKLPGHTQTVSGESNSTDRSSIINSIDFSPDGRQLASGGVDGTVRLWDAAIGELLASIDVFPVDSEVSEIKDLVFSPDGALIAIACKDGTVRLLDVHKLDIRETVKLSTRSLVSLMFDLLGNQIVVAGKDGKLRIWDLVQRREVAFCDAHNLGVVSLAVSHDGKRIVTSGAHDQTLKVWDAATLQLIQSCKVKGKAGAVRDFGQVTCSPDGHHAAIASDDNLVRIFSLGAQREALPIKAHTGPVRGIAFRTDLLLATCGEDGFVKLWDPTSNELKLSVSAHDNAVNAVAFSPDGQTLATAGKDGLVKAWQVADGRPLWTGQQHEDAVYALAFHPDGKSLFSAGHDGEIRMWESTQGKILGTAPPPASDESRSPINCLAIDPDGHQLAAGHWDGSIALYISTDKLLVPFKTLTGHQREVNSVAYSRDGCYLVSTDRDGAICFWDARRGKKISELSSGATSGAGHIGPVTAASFSFEGNRVISAGWDGILNVWDVQSRQVMLTLSGRHGRTYCVALSGATGNTHFASGHHDGTVLLWGR